MTPPRKRTRHALEAVAAILAGAVLAVSVVLIVWLILRPAPGATPHHYFTVTTR